MTRATFTLLIVSATGIGCAEYEPKPIERATNETWTRELAPETLRVAASELQHPILKPLQLDPSKGLSPDEIGVLAVILNPDLRAERDRRAIAHAQLLQAGLLPNPQLAANLDFPYDSSAPDDHTAYGLGLTWDITSLIGRSDRQRAAAEESQAIELEIAWKEWQTAQAAKTGAYNVIALEQALAIAREIGQQLLENRQLIQRAVDAHQKTVLDLSAAESAARDAEEAVAAQERELARERLQLNASLGLAPETVLKLRDQDLPSHVSLPTMSQLIDDMETRRLDLVALRHGYQSQEAAVRAAILGQFPKINAGPSLARDTSAVKTIGIGVTIDLPIFDRNQAAIAQERATRAKLFDEYTGRRFAARTEIALAMQEIQSITKQIEATETSVASLQRLTKTYKEALEQGNTDIVSFYSAVSELAKKRIEANKLKQELVQQWIALELASGEFLNMAQTATAPTSQTETGIVR
ncbi:MAG TPA: TolC family protein [Tepidisphaeraceae bacterium]|nr:TolC family protein [Tepidisphaeraceae bacterium]